jgi:hypothetical protein
MSPTREMYVCIFQRIQKKGKKAKKCGVFNMIPGLKPKPSTGRPVGIEGKKSK